VATATGNWIHVEAGIELVPCKAVDVEAGDQEIEDALEQIIGDQPGGFRFVADQPLHDGAAISVTEQGEGRVPVLSPSVPDEGQVGRLVSNVQCFDVRLLRLEKIFLHARVLYPRDKPEPAHPFDGRQIEMTAVLRQELLVLVEHGAIRIHEEQPEPFIDDVQCDLPSADRPLDELRDECVGVVEQ